MTTAPAQSAAPPAFEQAAVIAYVETDCFCEGCGYSLRGQAVRREATTQLLLCRCPECGRFQPAAELSSAGRLWLARLSMVLLVVWVVIVGGALVVQGLIELAIAVNGVDYPLRQVLSDGAHANPDAIAAAVALAGVVLGLAFGSAVVATAVFPHWRWWGYMMFVTVRPLLVAGLTWAVWTTDRPHSAALVAVGILYYLLLHIPAGTVGAIVGRPLVRLVVRIIFPKRLRAALGYLWIVDGKTPPGAGAGATPGAGASSGG